MPALRQGLVIYHIFLTMGVNIHFMEDRHQSRRNPLRTCNLIDIHEMGTSSARMLTDADSQTLHLHHREEMGRWWHHQGVTRHDGIIGVLRGWIWLSLSSVSGNPCFSTSPTGNFVQPVSASPKLILWNTLVSAGCQISCDSTDLMDSQISKK